MASNGDSGYFETEEIIESEGYMLNETTSDDSDYTDVEDKFLSSDEIIKMNDNINNDKILKKEREILILRKQINEHQKLLFEAKLESVSKDTQLLEFMTKTLGEKEYRIKNDRIAFHEAIRVKYDLVSPKWGFNPDTGELIDE